LQNEFQKNIKRHCGQLKLNLFLYLCQKMNTRRKGLVLTMTQKNDIREDYFCKGKNISQIARDRKHDRNTIRDIINCDDWNVKKTPDADTQPQFPKLEPFKELIDSWLIADKAERRKQRHTALRVFNRLKNEEKTRDSFNCSYKTVADYVKMKKKEIYGGGNDCYLPLEHRPGEAQVDFGTTDYYENDTRIEGKHNNMSFPYSNQGYTQLFPGENMECLLEGMVNIFKHIGGVPHEIWFDNMSTVVKEIQKGGDRKLTEKFERFKAHFGFKSIFCNPDSGHEKGSVEGKVGYHRRNLFVPVPRFKSLDTYNEQLLVECDKDSNREHYRKEEAISNLFEEDRQVLLPLPANEFDTSRYDSVKTNKHAIFSLEKGFHEYSTAPIYANQRVNIRMTATQIIVLDENYRPVVIHKRLYGKKKQRSMQWIPYLDQLAKRPRAVKYSGIYEMLPDEVRAFLDTADSSNISDVISMLSRITKQTSWENAVTTVDYAVANSLNDPDSIQALHRRLFMNFPEMPPLEQTDNLPQIAVWIPNLKMYDVNAMKGGASNV
jgi:hypothetical protein